MWSTKVSDPIRYEQPGAGLEARLVVSGSHRSAKPCGSQQRHDAYAGVSLDLGGAVNNFGCRPVSPAG